MKCEEVYLETYTNKWLGDRERLEGIIGKKIVHLKGFQVESDMLIDIAKETDVALLIPGDPLVATTHIQLMIDAKAKGVTFDVIHSSSIYTAVAETGLQLYKFGRATTLAFIEKSFKPSSPYEMIMENRKAGLHTLVLLDVKEDNRYMTVADGIYVLNHFGLEDIKIVVCCQLGSESQKIRYGNMKELSEDASLAETPAAIIIPGRLHFKEEEALRMYEQ